MPLETLLDSCHDYDQFYEIFSTFKDDQQENDEDKEFEYDRLEQEGFNFIDRYRSGYLLPAVTSVNAAADYLVAGVSPDSRIVVLY